MSMSAANKTQSVELDCFLEIEGASGDDAEEIAAAMADEIEAWISADGAVDTDEATSARELAKQIRLLGWLVSVEGGGADSPRLMEQLEQLVARATDLVTPPANSGVRRRLTPPAALDLSKIYEELDDEDDRTMVRKSMWDQSRSTNRLLDRQGSSPDLGDSGRTSSNPSAAMPTPVPPSFPSSTAPSRTGASDFPAAGPKSRRS